MEPTQGKFEVSKFDGEGDFTLWKHRMRGQLEILGFGSMLKPKKPEEEGEKSDPLWDEKDQRVRNLLGHGLTDPVLRKVMKEPTAYDMWTALENEYQAQTLPNRFYLKQRFFSFKMEEDQSLDKNLDTFNKLVLDLSSVNAEMGEEDKAAILMNSLPKKYDNLVHTLKYSSSKQTISTKEIIRSAYSIELELKQKGVITQKSADEGLFVQSRGRTDKRSKTKGKSSRSKSKVAKKRTCWICGSEEHLKKDCPKKYQPSSSQKGEASLAHDLKAEPLMLTASQVGPREGWVLDSGCSYHITKRKDLMFDVEEVRGGRILMGNDTSCEITAIVEKSKLLTMMEVKSSYPR